MRYLWLLGAAVLAGCQSPTLPDPNDPAAMGVVAPDVLRNNLSGASKSFFGRVESGEISDAEARKLLSDYAKVLLAEVSPDKVSADRAWEYAEVLLVAERWTQAKTFLEVAVKNAKNDDRRVNDTLRLARVEAMLGDIPKAIELARSTFDAPPSDKGPILLATLFEIVPAGRGKKHDPSLAELLVDAIPQMEQTVVDESTESGKTFIIARPVHIRNAYTLAVQLLAESGDRKRAQEVADAAERWDVRRREDLRQGQGTIRT